jgi:hypothetical protein
MARTKQPKELAQALVQSVLLNPWTLTQAASEKWLALVESCYDKTMPNDEGQRDQAALVGAAFILGRIVGQNFRKD